MTSTETNERTVLRVLNFLMDDYVQNLEMQWCAFIPSPFKSYPCRSLWC